MITIALIAAWRAACSFTSAAAHVVTHSLAWLMFPDTARYGACIDCSSRRHADAYERKYRVKHVDTTGKT